MNDLNKKTISHWKIKCAALVSHSAFTYTILGFIMINAVIVGLETYPELYASYQNFFWNADRILLWIFTIEILLRLFAADNLGSFFRGKWNWFDFLIVSAGHLFAGAHFVTVLRILRVLRVFRAVSVIPSLRRLVDALLMTIPSLGNILLLMSIIFYIFGVIGAMLFQNIAPEYFGTLERSILTLFQVVTLESWASNVMRPIMAVEPLSWIYFVSFVLVGTFVIFNLFIGVIVSNVEKTEPKKNEVGGSSEEIRALRQEIRELKTMIHNQSSKIN